MAGKPLKMAPRAITNIDPDGIKIERPSLDDDPDGHTVLRGRIDIDSLSRLRYGPYQREQLSGATNRKIQRAVENGIQLPDITLGMRGDRFTMGADGSVHLLDPVYVIDGRQRIVTIQAHLARYPADRVRLGAVVYFNTDQTSEQTRFHALGAYQTKISSNVIIRNLRETVPLVGTLYGLTMTQKDFPLHGRVCWQQAMPRHHLLSGVIYIQTALYLHSHLAATRHSTNEMQQNSANLARAVDIGRVRENVATFWEAIDFAWGLKALDTKAGVNYLKTNFLLTLARILSEHTDFWDGDRLVLSADFRRKLRLFKAHAPVVTQVAGSNGKLARDQLSFLLLEHLNYRQKKKLQRRRPVEPAVVVKPAA